MTYLLQKIGLRPTFCLLLIIRWGTENLRLSYTMTIVESRNCNVDDPECWRVQAAAQLQSDGRLQPGTRHRPSVRISTLHSANTGASGGGRFVNKTSGKYNFPLIKNNLQHYFYFRVSTILSVVCCISTIL